MKCRHCGKELNNTFLDLGFSPPSNAYLTEKGLTEPEKYYPLKIKVCDECWLVQTEDYAQAEELFNSSYAYFSSTSTSWLEHAKKYTEKVIEKFKIDSNKFVIEIASNDGYLLQNFINKEIPCLGIEPTASTAEDAEKKGIPVLREFFTEELGKRLANDGKQADLIIGNNVYAHVPDINDFTLGLKAALKHDGVITLEFPHLMQLLENIQFDTIYHEHFSYLSLNTVERIFEHAGLRVWNVEELSTHGGSLRVYGCHKEDTRKTESKVYEMITKEKEHGLQEIKTYKNFQSKVEKIKFDLIEFLIKIKKENKKIVAYGAAAKGNTLLNYSGIKNDLIDFVCDAALAKQNKYMPGSHIPIYEPGKIIEAKPDYVLILPWNISEEIKNQIIKSIKKEAKFIIAVPTLTEI